MVGKTLKTALELAISDQTLIDNAAFRKVFEAAWDEFYKTFLMLYSSQKSWSNTYGWKTEVESYMLNAVSSIISGSHDVGSSPDNMKVFMDRVSVLGEILQFDLDHNVHMIRSPRDYHELAERYKPGFGGTYKFFKK